MPAVVDHWEEIARENLLALALALAVAGRIG